MDLDTMDDRGEIVELDVTVESSSDLDSDSDEQDIIGSGFGVNVNESKSEHIDCSNCGLIFGLCLAIIC
eukprot:CAMPEP_0201591480 /NCGR_PEP_ID=MMETSP0190_2-20130828/189646_1 /ASSEMBLY_ACC=CAM_ASM_000263 /TAXON_ID=37353 /ORGANISM="Rosalina sp." /LENGTH=68 /DNA_ID=CAMNT_0048049839 /DNA_START=1458 /DNA_END=1664 /DNA_ORIENTATION=+